MLVAAVLAMNDKHSASLVSVMLSKTSLVYVGLRGVSHRLQQAIVVFNSGVGWR